MLVVYQNLIYSIFLRRNRYPKSNDQCKSSQFLNTDFMYVSDVPLTARAFFVVTGTPRNGLVCSSFSRQAASPLHEATIASVRRASSRASRYLQLELNGLAIWATHRLFLLVSPDYATTEKTEKDKLFPFILNTPKKTMIDEKDFINYHTKYLKLEWTRWTMCENQLTQLTKSLSLI